MTAERWAQVKQVLAAALEVPAPERAAFLESACGGDSSLRSAVEDLLGCEPAAAGIFSVTDWRDAPAPAPSPAPAPAPPQRIGIYRVLRVLGEGGMGIVYLAERDDGEFRQQVAVKVMRSGPGTAALLSRFRAEREILAQLQHPAIARILDGGSTADGLLYYAMEYVDGCNVAAYCERNGLNVRARLALFCRICQAVAHAHRNLIIHRDLKPANILVTADGSVKLLDFGLAKVFQEAPGEALVTGTVAALMTPGYASPEQVRGKPLGTATDVYSLGVILYELLAGQSPYGSQPSTLELLRAICELEPRPLRQATGQKLPPDLGDIVLKALRKEPEHRYAGVDQLREDVERHLQGLPVLASQGSFLYVVGKFVRRRRWAVAAATLVLLGAAAAFYAIWWQRSQAELRFQQVRQLARSVVFELHDAIEDLPGSTNARKLLVDRALQYLRDLEATGGKDRGLQMELAAAWARVGSVQGHQAGAHLGNLQGALASYRRAQAILRALRASDPQNWEIEFMLAEVDLAMCDIYYVLGDSASARALRPEIAALRWQVARRRPQDPAMAGLAHGAEAYGLTNDGRWAEAVQAWERAIASYQAALRLQPHNAETLRLLSKAYYRLAHTRQQAGDLPGAAREYRQAQRLFERRVAAMPTSGRAWMDLSFALVELGWVLQELHDSGAATAAYEQALGIQQRLSSADPSDVRARLELAKLRMTAAPAFAQAGNSGRAMQLLLSAQSVLEQELERDPRSQDIRFHIAWAQVRRGDLWAVRSDWDQASRHYRSAESIMRRLAAETPRVGEFGTAGMLAWIRRQLDPATRTAKLVPR